MANFSITISNSLRCLGPGVTNKWGFFIWGSDKWGEKETVTTVIKLISNSLSPNSLFQKVPNKVVSNSLSFSNETSSETLRDLAGYYYVFTGPATDAENRATTTYIAGTNQSTTWTSAVVGSTTWS